MTTRIIGIQARMGSTRLPGKALMDLGGKTMLERVVEAVQPACNEACVLAPSGDAAIWELTHRRGWQCVGVDDEHDVLARYMALIRQYPGDPLIMRVCADAPFIQPDWCRAAFNLAEITDKPVWIENFCHAGTAAQWREADVYTREFLPKDSIEHAGYQWFQLCGVQVRRFVPHDYLMVNTREDYEEAQRRLALPPPRKAPEVTDPKAKAFLAFMDQAGPYEPVGDNPHAGSSEEKT